MEVVILSCHLCFVRAVQASDHLKKTDSLGFKRVANNIHLQLPPSNRKANTRAYSTVILIHTVFAKNTYYKNESPIYLYLFCHHMEMEGDTTITDSYCTSVKKLKIN